MVKARLGAPDPQFKGNRHAFSRNFIRYAVNCGFIGERAESAAMVVPVVALGLQCGVNAVDTDLEGLDLAGGQAAAGVSGVEALDLADFAAQASGFALADRAAGSGAVDLAAQGTDVGTDARFAIRGDAGGFAVRRGSFGDAGCDGREAERGNQGGSDETGDLAHGTFPSLTGVCSVHSDLSWKT
jgi:hypothetical protein